MGDTGGEVNTQEIKTLFHSGLKEENSQELERSQKSLDAKEEDVKPQKILKLGKFSVDPKYTDFVGTFHRSERLSQVIVN